MFICLLSALSGDNELFVTVAESLSNCFTRENNTERDGHSNAEQHERFATFLRQLTGIYGMRVNVNRTKVMISGEWQKVMHKAVRWPCGVCCRGIGNNSMKCTS